MALGVRTATSEVACRGQPKRSDKIVIEETSARVRVGMGKSVLVLFLKFDVRGRLFAEYPQALGRTALMFSF
jgi:hypothetical protein